MSKVYFISVDYWGDGFNCYVQQMKHLSPIETVHWQEVVKEMVHNTMKKQGYDIESLDNYKVTQFNRIN